MYLYTSLPGINDRVKNATAGYSTLHSLPRGIYRFNAQGKRKEDGGLATIKYAGDQMLTIASVLVYVMIPSVSDKELELVLAFLDFLFQVRSCIGTEKAVKDLADQIFKFKTLWVEIFSPVEKKENGKSKLATSSRISTLLMHGQNLFNTLVHRFCTQPNSGK